MKARTVILISILSVGGLFITTPCFPGGPPDPLYIDSDGDSLCDDCEEWIFGTSPSNTDTDEDGIPDGDEDHDGDGVTNIQELKHIVALSEALWDAIYRGDIESVTELLEYIPYIPVVDRYRRTAVVAATIYGHTEIVQLLLQAGADVDDTDRRGYTALTYAILGGHIEIMQMLLEAGADVNARYGYGDTALIDAARGCK